MDFKVELAKLGYNNGNIISVETLVDEILPYLFSKQQERIYCEGDMIKFAKWVFLEVGSNTGKERTNKELFDEWFEQFKKK